MSTYTAEHASAKADIAEAGTAVSFSLTSYTYDETTDVSSNPVVSTVSGYAIRVKGDPVEYTTLGLVQSESPTLLFCPNTYGQMPSLNATVTWGAQSYTVRSVNPLAVNGSAILSRVLIAR